MANGTDHIANDALTEVTVVLNLEQPAKPADPLQARVCGGTNGQRSH